MTSEEAMRRISEILYPDGNLDHEWTSNELEWIAEIVQAWGWVKS